MHQLRSRIVFKTLSCCWRLGDHWDCGCQTGDPRRSCCTTRACGARTHRSLPLSPRNQVSPSACCRSIGAGGVEQKRRSDHLQTVWLAL